jgi:AcrR family transcriptional regulator
MVEPIEQPTKANPRDRLLEVALRRLEESGPEVLRARELTAEIGASTQALYTLYGGMPGLFEAIVADGFTRFAAYVEAVPESEDPVADFFAQGWAFGEWALTHPQLYRLMFGVTGGGLRRHVGLELTVTGAADSSPEARSAMNVMVRSMERVVASGRIGRVDPVLASGQFLSATHGYVLLAIAGVFTPSGDGLEVARAFGVNLMVGLGDSREAAAASMHTVETSKATGPQSRRGTR